MRALNYLADNLDGGWAGAWAQLGPGDTVGGGRGGHPPPLSLSSISLSSPTSGAPGPQGVCPQVCSCTPRAGPPTVAARDCRSDAAGKSGPRPRTQAEYDPRRGRSEYTPTQRPPKLSANLGSIRKVDSGLMVRVSYVSKTQQQHTSTQCTD